MVSKRAAQSRTLTRRIASETDPKEKEKLKKELEAQVASQRLPEVEARRQEALKKAKPSEPMISGSPESEERRREAKLRIEKTQEELDKERKIEILKEGTVKGELEKAGAFEEVTPTEVSLQPDTGEGFLAPSFEAMVAATQPKSLLGRLIDRGVVKDPRPTGEQEFPMTPETEREAALRQIKINSFNEGLSQREAFGTVVEAIPVLGGLIGKYVGGIVEAPYANQKNVLAEINKIKEAASTGQEKVRNGLEDPDYGLDRARQMEEDIAKLEGRIKLLINSSAVLRANTDEVNVIQESILEAREKISRYRTASEFGLTASLTGTGRPVPSDEQLFYELQNER